VPKSSYHLAVDQIQAVIRPWLADRDFRVRGRTFNRATEDGLTQVVNFQMGPSDPPGAVPIPGLRPNLHGLFTVNLGVYVPEVALFHGGGEAKAWVQDYHCAIRARLATVCADTPHAWWPAEASPAVIDELRECLSVGGLPWLDRFANRRLILDELSDAASKHWITPRRIVMAIILTAEGHVDEARSLLSEQVSENTDSHPHHAAYVRELAVRLGLAPLGG
jgi:hypothetical protein